MKAQRYGNTRDAGLEAEAGAAIAADVFATVRAWDLRQPRPARSTNTQNRGPVGWTGPR